MKRRHLETGWSLRKQALRGYQGNQFHLYQQDRAVSYGEAIELFLQSPAFRRFWCDSLAALPFPAIFWEVPPVSSDTLDQAFEFVVIHAPLLDGVEAEPEYFESYFQAAKPEDQQVVAFPNLGQDAYLLAPCPQAQGPGYPHLISFLRLAPEAQIDRFWQVAAEALQARIGQEPLWWSTSGAGVFWLHLRIDTRPKYYNYAPYR